MALRGDITYQTIINAVKNYLKNNCMNIASYGSIPSTMKSGYSESSRIGGNDAHYTTKTITCTSGVTQVSSSTVDTDMNNLLNRTGMNMVLSQPIKNEEFFRLLNNIISFCASNCMFASGHFDQNSKYLIYKSNNQFNLTETIVNISDVNLIEPIDVTSVIDALKTALSQRIKCFACTYSISMTTT